MKLNLFSAEHYVLQTSLNYEEAEARLRRLIRKADTAGAIRLTGNVENGRFTLRRSIAYRNGAQSEATGVLRQIDSGTQIAVALGVRRSLRAVAVVFYACMIAFVVLTVASRGSGSRLVGAAGLAVLTVAPIVLYMIGRYLARADDEVLLGAIQEACEAALTVEEARATSGTKRG